MADYGSLVQHAETQIAQMLEGRFPQGPSVQTSDDVFAIVQQRLRASGRWPKNRLYFSPQDMPIAHFREAAQEEAVYATEEAARQDDRSLLAAIPFRSGGTMYYARVVEARRRGLV